MIAASVLLASGCEEPTKTEGKSREQILLAEKERLSAQVDSLQQEKVELKKQMEVLAGLDAAVRTEALTSVSKITLSSRTNVYDKDEDGTAEMLVVYVATKDDTGDKIKAPGSIEVQLWDLNAGEENALLKTWNISAIEAKESWAGTAMTSYYRLKFDVTDVINGSEEELTVKVTFTDYLTGKVLKAQRVILKN